MKTETGVMVMKDGKGWCVIDADGHSTSYGWMSPDDAPIHNPDYVKHPTDVTWKGSYLIPELNTAKLVRVKRITTCEILE